MAVEAILLLDDRIEASNSAASITANSTANGYNAENVRETEHGTAWKPADGTSDVYVQVNVGAALGSSGQTAYVAIAYDAVGVDQNQMRLIGDDTGAGPWTQRGSAFTLDKTRPTQAFQSFTVGTPADQHFRLEQLNSQRGGGTKVARVFSFSLFTAAGVFRIGTDYAGDTTGPGRFDHLHRVQAIMVATNAQAINVIQRPQQEFELTFRPASLALWQALRDKVYDLDGPKRAFYVQFDGLRNPAQQDFAMVRMVNERLGGYHKQADQYDVTITLVTEASF